MKKLKKKVRPYKALPIADVIPNDWNPNKMQDSVREKLQAGIEEVLKQSGHIPPIVVRRHPELEGKYQIIDGFHRYDVLKELGRDTVDAFVLKVDTKIAMTLTSTLNYLRGEPESEGYAKYLHRMMEETHITPEDAAVYLPDTKDEIEDYLSTYDLEIEHVAVDDGIERDGEEKKKEEHWVEIKVLVSQEQAEIIEGELSRITGVLKGSKRNVRGRAMEFMAVNSSQTSIDNLTGEKQDEPEKKHKTSKGSVKKRLKDKAAA